MNAVLGPLLDTRMLAPRPASHRKYVSVRRRAMLLEESLYRGTRWVVCEPNDQPLGAQVRPGLGAFMRHLLGRGASPGRTLREAHLVRSDAQMTTGDIHRGTLDMLVVFAPLRPAEFVTFRIQQRAGRVAA